jgi:large subunit ribosomal protein L21
MQYAVIKSGGKQYKVSTGDTIEVDKIKDTDKKSVAFDVLLSVDEGKVNIGNPLVKGAKVEATIIENKKGDKIHVRRFKAKSRYRKVIGFRSQKTVVKIDKIDLSNKKEDKTDSKKEK